MKFLGYRRVFLSDYSGREMRPASLFLKVSKKWDAQWDRSPNLDPCLTNPRDVKPSETKVLRIHPFCYLIQIQRIWIPSIIYLLKKRKLLPATSDLLILAVKTYWLQWISSFDIYPYYFLARIKSAVIKKKASQSTLLTTPHAFQPVLRRMSTNYIDQLWIWASKAST